jgi:chitinase
VRIAGPGSVSSDDLVALRTEVKQTYVSADNGGGGAVNAAAPEPYSWETFALTLDDGTAQQPPSTGQSGGGSAIEQLLSQSVFESMFPDRNAFYTYDGLVQATATYPAFANTGSTDDRKREIAAFLANVNRETGALVYIEEIDKADYVNSGAGCDPEPGKQYYGRGPIQLSWTTNYCSASAAIFGDSNVLRADPDRVAREAWVAWATGLWYWMSTCHDPITSGAGFGATVRAINGPVECDGRIPSAVDDRVQAYLRFCGMLGVDPGQNLYC